MKQKTKIILFSTAGSGDLGDDQVYNKHYLHWASHSLELYIMKQWYSRWKSCSTLNIQFRRSFPYAASTLYFICHRFPHVYITLRPSISTLSFAVSNQLIACNSPSPVCFHREHNGVRRYPHEGTLHSKIPTSEKNTFPISLFTCLVTLNIAGTLPRHLSIYFIASHFTSTLAIVSSYRL